MKLAVWALLFPLIFFVPVQAAMSHADITKPSPTRPSKFLKIAVADNWPPFIYLDENNRLAGQDFELLESILIELGYGLRLVSNVSDNRRFYALGLSLHEVVVGAYINEERQKVSRFSLPYRSEKMGLFYTNPALFQAEKLDFEEEFDLKPLVGTMNLAAWAGEAFEEVKRDYPDNIMHIESQYSRLKMLALGRVDFTIGDTVSIKLHAEKMGIENFTLHPDILFEADIHFAFSKDAVDDEFINRFNAVLQRKLAEKAALLKDMHLERENEPE